MTNSSLVASSADEQMPESQFPAPRQVALESDGNRAEADSPIDVRVYDEKRGWTKPKKKKKTKRRHLAQGLHNPERVASNDATALHRNLPCQSDQPNQKLLGRSGKADSDGLDLNLESDAAPLNDSSAKLPSHKPASAHNSPAPSNVDAYQKEESAPGFERMADVALDYVKPSGIDQSPGVNPMTDTGPTELKGRDAVSAVQGRYQTATEAINVAGTRQMHFNNAERPTSESRSSIQGKKRKKTHTTQSDFFVPGDNDTVDADSPSDINDYMQILAFKINEHKAAIAAASKAEAQQMQVQIDALIDAKQDIQEERDVGLSEIRSLTAALEEQRTKAASHESRVHQLKKFVVGLGTDADWMRKEMDVSRKRTQTVLCELEDAKTVQHDLQQTVDACVKKSEELKARALAVCQEQIETSKAHRDYLEKQLSDLAGQLSEERDRRSQLERQLAAAVEVEQDVIRGVGSTRDEILSKLSAVESLVLQDNDQQQSSDLLERISSAVEAVRVQTEKPGDESVSVKLMFEGLSER